MPDRGRHARSKWEWGTPPQRSQERAAAAQDDPVRKKTPARKDPDLCKGQHWRGPHAPEIELSCNRITGQPGECYWTARYWHPGDNPYYWHCSHVLICSGCQKDFGNGAGRCPCYREMTPGEKEQIDIKIDEAAERRVKWRIRTRPVIDGPQGYRKKR